MLNYRPMNAAHWHLLLNHAPVIGIVWSFALLGFALLRRNDSIKRVALVSLVVAALVAVPAYVTGEPAEDVVESVPGMAKGILERHEDAAGVALGGGLGLGVLALAGLLGFRGARPVPVWFGLTTLAGALVVIALMAWTANLGGQIRHPEIRSAAMESISVGHDAD